MANDVFANIAANGIGGRMDELCEITPRKFEKKAYIIEKQYLALKLGAAQLNLSLKDVGNFTIPIPHKALQEQFVAFYEQSDKSKFEIKQSIKNITEVINSLLQQDFNI